MITFSFSVTNDSVIWKSETSKVKNFVKNGQNDHLGHFTTAVSTTTEIHKDIITIVKEALIYNMIKCNAAELKRGKKNLKKRPPHIYWFPFTNLYENHKHTLEN